MAAVRILVTACSLFAVSQWGPSEAADVCQRIAFSQSSQAGRKLYLLDVNESGLGNCGINSPVLLNSKVPRALDWK